MRTQINGTKSDISAMLLSAERYALGRQTYIVDWTCEFISNNLHLHIFTITIHYLYLTISISNSISNSIIQGNIKEHMLFINMHSFLNVLHFLLLLLLD